MKTTLEANHSINHCLVEAIRYLETKFPQEKFVITPNNDRQNQYMNLSFQPEDLIRFSTSELKSKASAVISEVNEWLKENGYSIQLTETSTTDSFAVASILEINTEWQQEGIETTLRGQSVDYKAFSLKLKNENTSIYGSIEDPNFNTFCIEDYANPVIFFTAKNYDLIYLLEADQTKELKNPTEMYRFIGKSVSKHSKVYNINKLVLPELDLNVKPDISWIHKMNFVSNNNQYFIDEAKQQIKFKMDKVGAEVKTATTMRCMSGSLMPASKTWYFDKPFYIWLCRPGTHQPYFSGYIDLESFQEVR